MKQSLEVDHESANPYRKLEAYADGCERIPRQARKKQAALRDRRVEFQY